MSGPTQSIDPRTGSAFGPVLADTSAAELVPLADADAVSGEAYLRVVVQQVDAAGCPVVVKAHPAHPQTSQATGRILEDALRRAGAPAGVFAVVNGFDDGVALISDPRIKAGAFTGSAAGGRALLAEPSIVRTECFGPAAVLVEYDDLAQVAEVIGELEGCLVATVHGEEGEPAVAALVAAQQHRGPNPASTSSLHTSVGTAALKPFLRPVAYPSVPSSLIPAELND